MNFQLISTKTLVIIASFCLLVSIVYFFYQQTDSRTKFNYCRSNKSEILHIRVENRKNWLISRGSPTQDMYICLAKSMPFYDRNIDGVIVLDEKELAGVKSEIMRRYRIKKVYIFSVYHNDPEYKLITEKDVDFLRQNSSLKISDTSFLLVRDTFIELNSKLRRTIITRNIDDRLFILLKGEHLITDIYCYDSITDIDEIKKFITVIDKGKIYGKFHIPFESSLADKLLNLNRYTEYQWGY